MYRDKERYGQDPTSVIKSQPKTFNAPLTWKEPKLIFLASWSDFFIKEADAWREEAWKIIKATPQHTYQILTKRPERIKDCLPADWGKGYPNVWLGVSVENQKNTSRISELVKNHAAINFISFEPLLGEIDLRKVSDLHLIDWAIIGGESGNDTGKYKYRPCDMSWIKSLIVGLERKKIAVFVKQLGTHLAKSLQLKDRAGADPAEWEKTIQIQQFPKS
jgi:protein gp37